MDKKHTEALAWKSVLLFSKTTGWGGIFLLAEINTYGAGGSDFYLIKTDTTGNVGDKNGNEIA